MKICFLDNTTFKYNSRDKYSAILRAGETALINLALQLCHLGHEITVFNNCLNNERINNINWININKLSDNNSDRQFDLAISNNDCNFFNKIISKKKILLSYSLQTIEKFIRKKQLVSYFKHRPKVALLSEYHKKKTSKLSILFGYMRLNLGVDELFIKTKLDVSIDKYLSIFTSRSDRNLDLLLDIWDNYIYPKFSHAKLLITPPLNKINQSNNIYLRNMNSQENMIKDVKKSRIFLIPGHKSELYCLAAEEARELCVPTVTLGLGSLSERVVHEKTGFIAKNKLEFSKYVIELYNNEKLWNGIRDNLFRMRGSNKWKNVAMDLLSKV